MLPRPAEGDLVQHPFLKVPVAYNLCVVPGGLFIGCEIESPSVGPTAEPAAYEVGAEFLEVLRGAVVGVNLIQRRSIPGVIDLAGVECYNLIAIDYPVITLILEQSGEVFRPNPVDDIICRDIPTELGQLARVVPGLSYHVCNLPDSGENPRFIPPPDRIPCFSGFLLVGLPQYKRVANIKVVPVYIALLAVGVHIRPEPCCGEVEPAASVSGIGL